MSVMFGFFICVEALRFIKFCIELFSFLQNFFVWSSLCVAVSVECSYLSQ